MWRNVGAEKLEGEGRGESERARENILKQRMREREVKGGGERKKKIQT